LSAGADVVLEQHRDAVHRPARTSGLALGVEGFTNRVRIGVELDHLTKGRPSAVECGDPVNVEFDEGLRRQTTAGHRCLEIGNARLLQLEPHRGVLGLVTSPADTRDGPVMHGAIVLVSGPIYLSATP
jgi:hypothetical protein